MKTILNVEGRIGDEKLQNAKAPVGRQTTGAESKGASTAATHQNQGVLGMAGGNTHSWRSSLLFRLPGSLPQKSAPEA
jgi:hypothetical protein